MIKVTFYDDLVKQMAAKAKKPEAEIRATLHQMKVRNEIAIRELRCSDGVIRTVVYPVNHNTSSAEKRAKKVANAAPKAWVDRLQKLGGIEKAIFGDVSADQMRKVVLG